MELQTTQKARKNNKQSLASKAKKFVYKNGATDITIEDLSAPSYQEIISSIRKKIGEMPKIPDGLPKGDWTEQALKVLGERYLMKNDKLEPVETPEQMVYRVAWEIASAEAVWGLKKKDVEKLSLDFYNLMVSRKFLPNSPTLMNAGTGNGLQYSACFVLPVEDSMEGIFDALKYQAIIHKTGGGTGFSFNRLRPNGSIVRTSSGTASGPVSFMKIFDAATNEVKQGGKRRGANMGILRVDHPDIMEFIHCKEQGGITNFNISVAVTDPFMEAYYKDKDYSLIDPRTKKVAGTLNARKVFDEIAQGAWRTGDPGLIFIDRINAGSANPIPILGPVESTNPCGEQPLYPYDACNLGSIFLGYFVRQDPESGSGSSIDWEDLGRVTRMATRFLDNVIEVNPYPLEQIRKTVFNSRRIGLGVGGWSDMLVDLGIPFDSEEALVLAEKVMKFIQEEALDEDRKLAKVRGAFPLFPVSIYREETPRRNSTITTIAPTGTISIIAGSSSGCEPMFAIAYQHIVKDKHLNRKLTFVEPRFEKVAKEKGFWSEELMTKVGEHGVIRDMEEIPADVRAIFGTAHEIDPEWHIKIQSAFQKYTENAVSKTINLRHEATVDDVKKAYLSAWESNCKGITIFRDGSKDAQVLNLGVNNVDAREEAPKAVILERPVKVSGATYRILTPLGSAFITINQTESGEPFELFVTIGKAGSEVAAMAEALGRLISTNFRFGNHLPAKERAREIMEQLQGIGGSRSVGFGPNKVRSLPDAVSKAIGMHFGFVNNTHEVSLEPMALQVPENIQVENKIGDICPSCGSPAMVYEEGCAKCHACGHSEC